MCLPSKSSLFAAAWAWLISAAAATPTTGFPAESTIPGLTPKPANWQVPSLATKPNPDTELGTIVTEADRQGQAARFLQQAAIDLQKQNGSRAALNDFNQAIAADPTSVSPGMLKARLGRADLLLQMGDFKGAIAEYDLVFLHDAANWQLFNDRGFAKMNLADYAGALDDFTLAIACDPDRALPYVNLGVLKTNQNDFAAALEWFEQAKARNPSDPVLYYSRSLLWRRQQLKANQRADLEEALALNPRHVFALRALGYMALQEADYADAIGYLNQVAALDPNDAWTYANRATALLATGRYAEAETDYINTINCSPAATEYFRIYLWIARYRQGKNAGEATALTAVLEGKEEWPKSIARYLSGQITEAQFRQASSTIPSKKPFERVCEAEYFMGMVALFQGDAPNAKEHLRNCVVTDQTDDYEYILASGELARMR